MAGYDRGGSDSERLIREARALPARGLQVRGEATRLLAEDLDLARATAPLARQARQVRHAHGLRFGSEEL
jgi:hypothetical protein